MEDNSYYPEVNNEVNNGTDNTQGGNGMAIASLILGIISLVLCCMCVNYITAPISIILAIIVLVKKKNGKGLAIAGLITSILSILLTVSVMVAFSGMSDAAIEFVEKSDEYVQEYEDTGEIPEFVEEFSEKFGIDPNEFMDSFVDGYKSQQ